MTSRLPAAIAFALVAFSAQAAEFVSLSKGVGDTWPEVTKSISIANMSGDGSVIAGSIATTGVEYDCGSRFGCGTAPFAWSIEERDWLPIGSSNAPFANPVGGDPLFIGALSHDGDRLLTTHETSGLPGVRAVIHNHDGTFVSIDSHGESLPVTATAMSSDGMYVAGAAGSDPFIWSQTAGLQVVEIGVPDTGYFPAALSDDGQRMALNEGGSWYNAIATGGFRISLAIEETGLPIRGNALLRFGDGTLTELLPTAGYDYSAVRDMTPSGRVAVGESHEQQREVNAVTRSIATVWVSETPVALALSEEFDRSWAMATTADGETVVGSMSRPPEDDGPLFVQLPYPSDYRSPSEAVLWRNDEAYLLEELLANEYALGDELAGWQLTSATAISDDGTVIAGQGIDPDGNQSAWVAILAVPEPCAATLVGCLALAYRSPYRRR